MLVTTDGGMTFSEERGAGDVSIDGRALAVSPPGVWAADSSTLYDLANGGVITPIFNNIRAMVLSQDQLWFGSDDQGAARYDASLDPALVIYKGDPPLASDKVLALAVDTDGDIWAATGKGVARFKKDRQDWVNLDRGTPGERLDNLQAILVDEANGRRAIYVASDAGLSYMTLP